MKCKNCTADVPPQWVHAINSNTCPSCGGELMSQEDLSVLADVRDAISQMPNNPEGLAGWLLTHFKLTKVGDAEPTAFYQKDNKVSVKSNTPSNNSNTSSNPNMELFNKFMKRTGVKMPDSSIKSKISTSSEPLDMNDIESDDEDNNDNHHDDNDEEILIPSSPISHIDPKDAIIKRQDEARQAFTSGNGKFSRS